MSGMLDKLHRKHQIELEVTRHVTRQEMVDFAAIALNDAFGFGPERCKKICGRPERRGERDGGHDGRRHQGPGVHHCKI